MAEDLDLNLAPIQLDEPTNTFFILLQYATEDRKKLERCYFGLHVSFSESDTIIQVA